MELLSTLGIDWKLLIAQLINFGVLIVVLSYFVYKPILRLIDDRREKIRKSMEDVKAVENQRRDMETWKTEQMKKMDQETGKFLEAAKKQAEAVKKELMESAQKEAADLLTKAKKQLDEERKKMTSEVQSSFAKVVVSLTEKILEREFGPEDQKRVLQSLEKAVPSLVR